MSEKEQQIKGKKQAPGQEHPLRQVRIGKITLNIGAGKDEAQLKKGLRLLQKISPQLPVKTFAKKRIPAWGLRPGLAIGAKVTLRKGTEELLHRLLAAKENTLQERQFDELGNVSFGIPEYIDIVGLAYDPELKIMGLEVAVTLERPGYRIIHRKFKRGRVGKRQQVYKAEAIHFFKKLGVNIQP